MSNPLARYCDSLTLGSVPAHLKSHTTKNNAVESYGCIFLDYHETKTSDEECAALKPPLLLPVSHLHRHGFHRRSTPCLPCHQSGAPLNQAIQTSGLAKCSSLLPERGTPEGQEADLGSHADKLCDFLPISAQNCPFKPASMQHVRPTRPPFLQSRVPGTLKSSAHKMQILATVWAKNKWTKSIPHLPNLSAVIKDRLQVTYDGVQGSNPTAVSPGDPARTSSIYKCYVDFATYSGKPLSTRLIVNNDVVVIKSYNFTNSSPPVIWTSLLSDLVSIKVKWNYSKLLLSSNEKNAHPPSRGTENHSIVLDFLDPTELRLAVSHLDIILRWKLKGKSDIVSVELPCQCQNDWHHLLVQIGRSDQNVCFVGFVFFEELLLPSQDIRDSPIPFEKTGFLMYSWTHQQSWQVAYFVVKDGFLSQFNHPKDRTAVTAVALNEDDCIAYSRNLNSSRPYTIEIRIRGNKCLLLAAASESEANEWLASLSKSSLDRDIVSTIHRLPFSGVKAVASGVVVTEKAIMLFKEAQNVQFIATACLDTVSVIASPDYPICTIECDYMEASERAGDWIFFFQTSDHLEEFLRATGRRSETMPFEMSSKLHERYCEILLSFP